MKLSLKLLTVLIVGVCQSLAMDAPKAELGTCHTEDYIKCALVIAGCSSTCSGSSVSIFKLAFMKSPNPKNRHAKKH